MRSRGYGRIINITSMAEKKMVPNAPVYAGLKAGVAHFSRSVSSVVAGEGITINCVAPGISKPMAKVYCSEMALEVTLAAQQILGGYGYLRDMPVEKWVRDACVGPIYDFTNDMLKVNHILPALAFAPDV